LFYVALTGAKDALYLVTESGRRSPFLDEVASRTDLEEVDWNAFPPILQEDGWLVVKVLGPYEAIESLIPGLKADNFHYRDLSRSGGSRTWDRVFRTTELAGGFLVNSPWMVQAKATGATGVEVQFFDGLEKLRAQAEVVGDRLVMTSSSGASSEFDILLLRSIFSVGDTPSSSNLRSNAFRST
jgi:hypothetical protein